MLNIHSLTPKCFLLFFFSAYFCWHFVCVICHFWAVFLTSFWPGGYLIPIQLHRWRLFNKTSPLEAQQVSLSLYKFHAHLFMNSCNHPPFSSSHQAPRKLSIKPLKRTSLGRMKRWTKGDKKGNKQSQTHMIFTQTYTLHHDVIAPG